MLVGLARRQCRYECVKKICGLQVAMKFEMKNEENLCIIIVIATCLLAVSKCESSSLLKGNADANADANAHK